MPAPDIGTFDVEVYGKHRRTASKFSVRCDALGHHEQELLLLSVIGPETAIKSIVAGLRSSEKDQGRIMYTAHVGSLYARLFKSEAGYRVYRAKMGYGLWHCLCVSKKPGF